MTVEHIIKIECVVGTHTHPCMEMDFGHKNLLNYVSIEEFL